MERRFNIEDGFSRYLLPAENQCFVFLEVSQSHYRDISAPASAHRDSRDLPLPRILEVVEGHPVVPPPNLFFSEDEIPGTYDGRVSIALLRPLDCRLALADQTTLLRELGFLQRVEADAGE